MAEVDSGAHPPLTPLAERSCPLHALAMSGQGRDRIAIVALDRFNEIDSFVAAGGCLSSQYLAFRMIQRLLGLDAARQALTAVAPVGAESATVSEAERIVAQGTVGGAKRVVAVAR